MKKMIGILLLSGMVMMAACGGEATESGKTADSKEKPATTTPAPGPTKVSAGGTDVATGSLPDNFPKDLPIYTGSEVVSSAVTGGMASAVLSTSDDVAKVAAFYKEELAKNGWSAPQVVDAAGNTVMRSTKEKRQAAVSIGKGPDGKTNISVSITEMP